MHRVICFALGAVALSPALTRGEQPAYVVAPAPQEFHGPQLPEAAEESREVVRLASAIDPGTFTPEPPHPVADPAVASPTEAQLLLEEKVAELERLQADIDELRVATGTPQQFHVNVEVLEVSRTKMRKLGMDLATFSNGQLVSTSSEDFFSGHQSLGHAKVARSFIDGLKQNNVAKSMANPSLVTVSGRPATMQLGGTFPVPAAPGAASAVEFQEYGTKITVRPESLGNDRVRLEINPRISEIDPSHSIEINGQRVPGLRVTEISTATEIELGETFAFGGLVTTRIEAHKFEDGRVVEAVNEIETWLVVSVEDVLKLAAAQSIAAPEPTAAIGVPYSPPSIR